MPPVATIGAALLLLAVVRGPASSGAPKTLIARAVTLARGTPILAEDVEAEQIALAGGRIWVGNPIDAFSQDDQITYLNWIDGRASGQAALAHGEQVVITGADDAAEMLMARQRAYVRVARSRSVALFVRRVR
jgi:hypothetical protein